MIIYKRFQIILLLPIFILILTPSSSFSSDLIDQGNNNFPVQTNSSDFGGAPMAGEQDGLPCQQVCYQHYKANTDVCYSTSIASEDLNVCIMSQRESFKACSKSC